MCLGVVAILLLNVLEVFSVWCACDPSLCVCMSEVIYLFKNLRVGAQMFALLILFLYMIVHTMWSGKSLQLLCILPFGRLCLSAISMMFVKSMLAVCMLVSMMV